MSKLQQKKGFSLLEMIVYVAILGLVLVVLVNTLITVSRGYSQFRGQRAQVRAATLALERITREVRQASSVRTASSTLAVTPGALVLNTTTASGSPSTIGFSLAGGKLLVTEGASTTSLLSDNVQVATFTPYRIVTAHSEGVKIDLALISTSSTGVLRQAYSITAILRGSY